jgi:hypothetical protein
MQEKSFITVEFFVVVDENGDYAIGESKEQAVENYESEVEALFENCDAVRLVKVKAKVTLPTLQELEAEEVTSEELQQK